MTGKAYIVANKEQELDVLNKFEKDGLVWLGGETPTDWITSETVGVSFPYALIDVEWVFWRNLNELDGIEIVYDGRKEEKMYKVTQEFMNELIEWREHWDLDTKTDDVYTFVDGYNIQNIPDVIGVWWADPDNPIENNERLIAIVQWLNGEDVFEVEEPHKFVVRSENTDGKSYNYVKVSHHIAMASYREHATKFNTREEAQEWANSHQVVVEIDEEGNEVE